MVALHPEGVDRNHVFLPYLGFTVYVALHPEGVDRNFVDVTFDRVGDQRSPSTRRAWIEIC